MILWTIQNWEIWEVFQSSGVLRQEPQFVPIHFVDAYRWMADKMEKHIGPAPASGQFPVWAWYQTGFGKRRPDLREGGWLPKGQRGVRIEFEVPGSKVLLSDFVLWHYVLNGGYLAQSEEDYYAFAKVVDQFRQKKGCPLPLRLSRKIEQSWDRVLDLEWFDEFMTDEPDHKMIQATLWELRIEAVLRVTEFTAR